MAAEEIDPLESALAREFTLRRFAHRINISAPGSKLQVQIQTDSRYFDFVDRAEIRDVMDFQLPVAKIADILKGKVWAATDTERRQSKRQKDLADIARILEVSPHLRSEVPAQLLSKLI